MTAIRGSNPIWFNVDLSAHAFDDTFYLFILSNDIPYIPLTVWHDPFENVVWTNPIQYLANGTLPENIYYDPDTIYRLEYRQGPTQSDPLIYLVENYVPGSGGSTPVDEVSFSTDNQVTNPQFALINFDSPLTLSSISTQVIHVAPGWFLNLTGTGNVILTQVLLNDSVIDPTNASYALEIQLNGSWSNAYLSQRFTQTGVLWSNTYISSSIMALSGDGAQSISATIVDSQANTVASVLPTTLLTSEFVVYPSVSLAAASMDSDFPPGAYIEYQLLLPNNCDITLSSIQLISGDVNVEYPYQQTTIERQIDQTYHNAFPIVPIGTIIDFFGFTVPAHYYFCDGSTKNRISDYLLFSTITTTETVTLTSTMSTFTVADGTQYYIGMGLEGTGIPPFTTITGISTNTITMSSPATATVSSSVRFYAASPQFYETVTLTSTVNTFTVASATNYGIGMAVTGNGIPVNTTISNIVGTTITISNAATISGSSLVTFYGVGNGDTTTTFNLPDLRGYVIAGSGSPNEFTLLPSVGVGAKGGSATHTLVATELPPLTVPLGTIMLNFTAGSSPTNFATNGSTNVAPLGTSTPFSIIQPTTLAKKCIRFEY